MSRRAVVLDDRLGLRVVEREPARDRLGRVVGRGPPRGARPSSALDRDLVGELEEEDRVERAVRSPRASRRAPRPGRALRGKPSRTKPPRASSCAEPLADQPDRRARRGRARRARGSARPARPSSVPVAIAARNMSPSRCAGSRTRPRSASPGCPCPTPAGPRTQERSASLLEEALVGAHHHLRLHLPHRVERDADRRSAPRCRRARRRSPARSRRSG